ncbi:MAG TPA: histidine phosphatase family protein [Nitrososphaerales archaeon]|nr:histidine phosphatase family protein [Nitrososphaerales archaeon]
MPLENLFIVRHGETEANRDDVDAGSMDYPLDKKGKKEVGFIAKTLADIKVSAVYCSPVRRAVQTAKILAKPHKLKVNTLDDLTEAKLKASFVGKAGRHHMLQSPDAFQETYTELEARVVRAVAQIQKEVKGNAIMVTHGDVIVAYLQHVVERKEPGASYYVMHPNPGSLAVVEFTDRPRLGLFNYHRKMFDRFENPQPPVKPSDGKSPRRSR